MSQSFFRHRINALALVPPALLGAATGHLAYAQDAAIEEVIVTAQRAEQSIQEVPIAVTALTGTMMEEVVPSL